MVFAVAGGASGDERTVVHGDDADSTDRARWTSGVTPSAHDIATEAQPETMTARR